MAKEFGYSLSILETSINQRAHDPGYEQILLDRQLQLAHIERLEHIALAMENLSDVGDVLASYLTFGKVPSEGGAPVSAAPGVTGSIGFPPEPGTVPKCDAPGCTEDAASYASVAGVFRKVCVSHRPMLDPPKHEPEGGDDAK